jgi:hypothetical protein
MSLLISKTESSTNIHLGALKMARHINRTTGSRKLKLESLENRQLMAGNITAGLDSQGTLQIRGDSVDNGVAIYQVNSSTLRVEGLSQGGSGTRVNGSTSFRDFRNVQGLNVDLGAGNDRIEVGTAASSGRTTYFARGANIHGGTGNDNIKIERTATNMDVNITGGSGHDSIVLKQVQIGSPVDEFRQGGLLVEAGLGNDVVDVSNTSVNQTVHIDSGLGVFSDHVKLNAVSAGQNVMLFANEPDSFRTDTRLKAELQGVSAGGNVMVDARRAQAQISLKQISADAVFAELGDRDDSLHLESIQSNRTQVSGGNGFDTLTTYLPGPVHRTGFEREYTLLPILNWPPYFTK